MSKKKKDELLKEKKPFIITNAVIKDAICSYGYEVGTGPCEGDQIKSRTGSSIVHDDMITAFRNLNVHLAILDDDFLNQGKNFDEMMEGSETFSVIGFKVSGTDENEGFVINGEKWVAHGSINLASPKINKHSAYAYFTELQEAIEAARTEVELYMNGKSSPKFEQSELEFAGGEEDEFNNPI